MKRKSNKYTTDCVREVIIQSREQKMVIRELSKLVNIIPSTVSRILKGYNKPGTAQVGAISKAQKDSKTTFSTTGDNKSSQKTKN